MAQFYGGVVGGRGEATRMGHKNTGLEAYAKSWTSRADIRYSWDEDNEENCLTISVSIDGKTVILFDGSESKFRSEFANLLR